MLRVVLDANVIVSGIASLRHGRTAPPVLLRLWGADAFSLVTSSAILTEVRNALGKPYFRDRPINASVKIILDALGEAADQVPLEDSVMGIATHRHDDPVLETALTGEADYLVTGDRKLLDLEHPYPFAIIHPKAFLAILQDDVSTER
jgi:putative PIN family toxin of toxin-antitoxin system